MSTGRPLRPLSTHKWRSGAEIPIPLLNIIRLLFCGYSSIVIVLCLIKNAEYGVYAVILAFLGASQITAAFWPFLFHKREYGLGHPIIIVSTVLVINMLLRSTGLLINGLDSHLAVDGDIETMHRLFCKVQALQICSVILLYLGIFYRPQWRLPNFSFTEPRGARLYLAAYVGSAISIGGTILFAQAAGGISGLLTNLSVGSSLRYFDNDVQGIGQYIVFMYFAPAAALLWLSADKKALANPWFWPIGAIGLLVPFLQAGRRSALIYTAVMFLLVWALRGGRLPYLRVVWFVILAVVVFGVVGEYRRANFDFDGTIKTDIFERLTVRDAVVNSLAEMESRSGEAGSVVPIVAKVPSEVPLLLGSGYARYFTLFIPRQFWPSKPHGVGRTAGEVFFGVNWGIPPGALGEAFWNFHVVGVVVVFLGSGMILGYLGRILSEGVGGSRYLLFYVPTVVLLLPPSNEGFVNWCYVMAPLPVLCYIAGGTRMVAPGNFSSNKNVSL